MQKMLTRRKSDIAPESLFSKDWEHRWVRLLRPYRTCRTGWKPSLTGCVSYPKTVSPTRMSCATNSKGEPMNAEPFWTTWNSLREPRMGPLSTGWNSQGGIAVWTHVCYPFRSTSQSSYTRPCTKEWTPSASRPPHLESGGS